MCNELKSDYYLREVDMQKIDTIVNELKTIMLSSDISQTAVVNLLDGKCARNTILSFYKGDADCKLSTLLMILDACGVELRFETERSKQAIIAQDISDYRDEAEKLRTEIAALTSSIENYKARNEELAVKNKSLTTSVEKQQTQIEKYMERMERAEDALYKSNDDCRRKDEKIVKLMKDLGKW